MTQPPSCTHPNHLPPAQLAAFAGTHLHECPGCRKVMRFTVEYDIGHPQQRVLTPRQAEIERALTKVVVGTNR